MLALTLAFLANAADLPPPTATVQDDGSVIGSVELAVPPETLRARLADPAWLPTISKDGTTVTLTGKEGGCQLIKSESPNVVMTARYTPRRCPTADGYQSTLIEGNAFDTYATSWSIIPTETGARATYKVSLTTSLWVPNSMVRRTTRNTIQEMLVNLQTWSQTAQ